MADNIGNWNPTNCVFGIFPENLKLARDNTDQEHVNLDNFATGKFPLFQGESAGSTISGTLINMATGYGYNDGKLVFDGVNDYLLTDYLISVSNTSKHTFEFRLDRVDATAYYIGGAYDDSDNYFAFYIGSDNKVWLTIVNGGVTSRTKSTDTILSTTKTVSFTLNNGTGKIYFDGVEVSAYDYQETYSSGAKTFTNGFRIGNIAITPAYRTNIYNCVVYDASSI